MALAANRYCLATVKPGKRERIFEAKPDRTGGRYEAPFRSNPPAKLDLAKNLAPHIKINNKRDAAASKIKVCGFFGHIRHSASENPREIDKRKPFSSINQKKEKAESRAFRNLSGLGFTAAQFRAAPAARCALRNMTNPSSPV